MRYVIVGGSIAGASATRAIRTNDPEGTIVMVTTEKPFYYRPLIPLIIDDEITQEDIFFPEDIQKSHGIQMINDRAVALDTEKKELTLESGNMLEYDKLLIATGSVPLLPDVPGTEKAFTLRTLTDAHKIKEAAAGASRTVILGGGFVGIKAAGALLKLGLNVTIIEKLPQILFPRLDQKSAAMVQKKITEKGVGVITTETITEVLDDGVSLTSGDVIEADLVILAIGVSPNIGWLERSGLKTEKAVVVDEFLKTSAEDCYAAGDVVQAMDLVEERPAVSVLWTNAVDMGKAAGTNMAGGKKRYPGLLSVLNATEIEGLPMVSVGAVADEGGEVFIETGNGGYRKLVFRDDRLIGAIFMGRLKNSGIYTNWIKNQTPLGNLKDKAIKGTLSYVDFMPKQ
ncbi:MAG: NAD(P)/FAD-dependent oxidoreductase [Deltaproteobacteria bacterium]|nr:MAG: NAD(P)/FAD-dependent oxidoreductase [Deltaproteobacteria bacterium]